MTDMTPFQDPQREVVQQGLAQQAMQLRQQGPQPVVEPQPEVRTIQYEPTIDPQEGFKAWQSALKQDAVLYQQAQQFARERNIDPAKADQSVDVMNDMLQYERSRMERMRWEAPAVYNMMQTPYFAKMAAKETDKLARAEISTGGWLGRQFDGHAQQLKYAALGLEAFKNGGDPETLSQLREVREIQRLYNAENEDSTAGWIGQNIIQATMFMAEAGAITAGTALATGPAGVVLGPTAGLSYSASIEAGSMFADLALENEERKANNQPLIDLDAAAPAVGGAAVIAGALDMIGLKGVARPWRKEMIRGALKASADTFKSLTEKQAWTAFRNNMLTSWGGETLTEGMQKAIMVAGEHVARASSDPAYGDRVDWQKMGAQMWNEAWAEMGAAAVGIAPIAVAGPIRRLRRDLAHARIAENQTQRWTEAMTEIRGTTLMQNAPGAAGETMGQIMRKAGIEHVYVNVRDLRAQLENADAFETAAVAQETGATAKQVKAQAGDLGRASRTLRERLPEVARQIDEAVDDSVDVKITVQEFVEHLAGVRLGLQLEAQGLLKYSADGMTKVERDALQKQAEKLAAFQETVPGQGLEPLPQGQQGAGQQTQVVSGEVQFGQIAPAQPVDTQAQDQAVARRAQEFVASTAFPDTAEGREKASLAAELEMSFLSTVAQEQGRSLQEVARDEGIIWENEPEAVAVEPQQPDPEAERKRIEAEADLERRRNEALDLVTDPAATLTDAERQQLEQFVYGAEQPAGFGGMLSRRQQAAALRQIGVLADRFGPDAAKWAAGTITDEKLAALIAKQEGAGNQKKRIAELLKLLKAAKQVAGWRPGRLASTKMPPPDAGILDPTNPPTPIPGRREGFDGDLIVALMDFDGNIYYDRNATMHGEVLDTFPELDGLMIDGGFIRADGTYVMSMSDAGYGAYEGDDPAVIRRVKKFTRENNKKAAEARASGRLASMGMPFPKQEPTPLPTKEGTVVPMEASTRVPTAKGAEMQALDDQLLVDWEVMKTNPKLVATNLDVLKSSAMGIAYRWDETQTPEQQIEGFIDFTRDNLVWLHERMDPAWRARAKLWYVGARRIADWMAKRYNISPMQAAGILAVLSPQKNWFENVSMADRIADILFSKRDATWTPGMQALWQRLLASKDNNVATLKQKLASLEKPKRPVKPIVGETDEQWQRRRDRFERSRERLMQEYEQALAVYDERLEELEDAIGEARETQDQEAVESLSDEIAAHKITKPERPVRPRRIKTETDEEFAQRKAEYPVLLQEYESAKAKLEKQIPGAEEKRAELYAFDAGPSMKMARSGTLKDLLDAGDLRMAGYWVRLFDEAHNSRSFAIITPEGGMAGPSMTGEQDARKEAKLRWGSYNTILKAISIFEDGRFENIHVQVGGAHKVRNFYNNIYSPWFLPAATIDTHAIAAALMQPLSASDSAVAYGLGGKVKDARLGLHGGYAIFLEGYRRAAALAKPAVQVREEQSITWEAIRGLFEAKKKRGMKQPVNDLWAKYRAGEATLEETREAIWQMAGGITAPEWVDVSTEIEPASSYAGESRAAMDAVVNERAEAKPDPEVTLMLPVQPATTDVALAARYAKLTDEQKMQVSSKVIGDFLPKLLAEFETAGTVGTTIATQNGVSSLAITVTMPNTTNTRQIARAIGNVFGMDNVTAVSSSKFVDSTATTTAAMRIAAGSTPEQISSLQAKLAQAGFNDTFTHNGFMLAVLPSDAVLTTLEDAVGGDPVVESIGHFTSWVSHDRKEDLEVGAGRGIDSDRRRRLDRWREQASDTVLGEVNERAKYNTGAIVRQWRESGAGGDAGAWSKRNSSARDAAPVRLGELLGVELKGTEWIIPPAFMQIMRDAGMRPRRIVELKKGEKVNAEAFRQAVLASKKANTQYGAAVHAYTAEDYLLMRLFLTDDGEAGFALKKDGDIVSCFGSPSKRGDMTYMLQLAINQGGWKADSFDTALPYIYAAHGLYPVARMPWDDKQKPEDWDYEKFKEWQNGRPDVIWYAYNPNWKGKYTRDQGPMVEWPKPLELQEANKPTARMRLSSTGIGVLRQQYLDAVEQADIDTPTRFARSTPEQRAPVQQLRDQLAAVSGPVIRAYHGTNEAPASKKANVKPFVEFRTVGTNEQLGAHFSEEPAVAGTFARGEDGTITPKQVFDVYLRINNPIRLIDLGSWGKNRVLPQLVQQGLFKTREEADRMLLMHSSAILALLYGQPIQSRVADAVSDPAPDELELAVRRVRMWWDATEDRAKHPSQRIDLGNMRFSQGDIRVWAEEKAMQLLLQMHGYDGVVYLNRREIVLGDVGAKPAFDLKVRIQEQANRDNATWRTASAVVTDEQFLSRIPEARDSYIVFNESQIKSADAVTFTEDGKVIPLDERDDQTKPSILYSRGVTERSPEMTAAAQDLKDGKITAEEYRRIADLYKPVTPYTQAPQPATYEQMWTALKPAQRERLLDPLTKLKAGHPVGVRLDIPAYENHGTWIVSVHEQDKGNSSQAGTQIGYASVARLTNAKSYITVDKAALNIAAGQRKGTIAVIKGDWVPTTPEEAKALADAALNDPAWTQVGMDPTRRSFFYDRKTMQPVVAAEEVIQIGPLVLAKNVTTAPVSQFLFAGGFQEEANIDISTRRARLLDQGNIKAHIHEQSHNMMRYLFAQAQRPFPNTRHVRDAQVLLGWFGVADFQEWNALPPAEQEKHWEAFSYSFEKYMFEGVAPTPGLRGLFDRLSRWIRRYYQDVIENINAVYRRVYGRDLPMLTNEVRAVMGRMLAAEKSVDDAITANALEPMFQTREEFDGTDEEWAAMQERVEQARDAAVAQLQHETIRQIQFAQPSIARAMEDRERAARAQRNKVRAEVEFEIRSEPVYRLINYFKTGMLIGEDNALVRDDSNTPYRHKLHRDTIARMPDLATFSRIERDPAGNLMSVTVNLDKYMHKNGSDPEQVATAFGFVSVDPDGTMRADVAAMMKALAVAPPVDDAIEAATQARMERDFGNLLDPEARNQAVLEAVHGELRARMTASEALWLDKNLLVAAGALLPAQQQRMQAARDALASIVPQLKAARAERKALLSDQTPLDRVDLQRLQWLDMQIGALEFQRGRFAGAANSTVNELILTQAAAGQARKNLSRRVIGQINAQDFVAMERRAAKDAKDALTNKVTSLAQGARDVRYRAASQHKQRQLLYHQMAAEALSIRRETELFRTFVSRLFNVGQTRAKQLEMLYVHAAQALLAEVGYAPASFTPERVAQIYQTLQELDPVIWQQIEPRITAMRQMIASLPAQNIATPNSPVWERMTVEQWRGFRDMIESLYDSARERGQILVGERRQSFRAARDLLLAAIDERTAKGPIPGEERRETELEKKVGWFRSWWSSLKRVEHYMLKLDGGKEGTWTKLVWKPINAAFVNYETSRARVLRTYADMLRAVPLEQDRPKSERAIEFRARDGRLIYTFTDMAELLGALLHTGNDSNKRKMILGGVGAQKPFGQMVKNATTGESTLDSSDFDAFVERLNESGRLRAEHWQFLQNVWNLNESLLPSIQGAHKRITGSIMKTVGHRPITNRYGTFQGGYVPAKIDSGKSAIGKRVENIAELQADMRQQLPMADDGFTKERIESVHEPLVFDLRMVESHLDQVVRYVEVAPYVNDVNRLLTDYTVSNRMFRMNKALYNNVLRPFLSRALNNTTSTPHDSKLANWLFSGLRRNTTLGKMFLNVPNALQNLAGLPIALLRVPPRYWAHSIFSFATGGWSDMAQNARQSAFMDGHLGNQMSGLINEMRNYVDRPTSFGRATQFVQQHALFLQSGTQNIVDIIVWNAAFDQAMAEADTALDQSEARTQAIRYADSVIRTSQLSLRAIDVSATEAGTPFLRLLTQFMSYFNSVAQANGTAFEAALRSVGYDKAKAAPHMLYFYLVGIALPAVVGEALVRALGRGFEEEDEDGRMVTAWFDMLVQSQVRFVGGMVPFGQQAASVTVNAWDDSRYNDRMSAGPAIESLVRAGGSVGNLIDVLFRDGKLKPSTPRDFMSLVTMVSGVPLEAAGRPVGYLTRVGMGRAEPETAMDWIRGLISGQVTPGTGNP